MELQRLPVELRVMIWVYLVDDQGLEPSLKIGFAFRSMDIYKEIRNVVVERSPISEFGKGLGRKILRSSLNDILEQRVKQYRQGKLEPVKSARTKKLEREPYFVPEYITSILDHVEEISSKLTGFNAHHDRTKRESILCDVMVYHHSQSDWANCPDLTGHIKSETELLRLLTLNRNCPTNRDLIEKWEDTFERACIGALAAIGHHEALQVTLSPSMCEMGYNSYAFPYPFCAAVLAGQHSVIDAVLNDLMNIHEPEDFSPEVLLGGAACALKRGKLDIAKEILELGADFLPVVASGTFEIFLAKAVESGDACVVSLVLDMAHDCSRKCYIDAFANACKNGQVTIAGLFFEKNILNINQNFKVAGLASFSTVEHTDPISTAIMHAPCGKSRAALVKELIRLGASPDGPRIMSKGFWCLPLVVAARMGCQETILVLLNSFADLTLSSDPKAEDEKLAVLKRISDRFQYGLQYLIKPSVRQELRKQLGFGAEPDRNEPSPFIALAMGVKEYRWGDVQSLLNSGAAVNFRPAGWRALIEWDDILKAIHVYFSDGRHDMLSDEAWWKLNKELAYNT
ncbi:hypothetical protein P171DRAFT_202690 [Karstenula rhodostoma CBS 690.94]|uniref:Ankyrin n=1 Tax=Karstenula rhodostoma CBS 690.94 TaxID=1392251 RepID=A0A9P4PVD1_9PLEO|nr:hypothetical protein P171DRAFT_202690 [Karstenula rhodostoma CBS 690.94]